MKTFYARRSGLFLMAGLFLLPQLKAAEARVNQLYSTTCTACGLQQQSITLSAIIPSLSNFRFISQNPNDASFTGNDIKGILMYTDLNNNQVMIRGIISRTIKSGNQQLGVYMAETDNNWVNLTGAAYVLVIPGQEANLGSGQTYGSASDPMDAVLNAPVLPVTGLNLKAQRLGANAFLQWTVLSEKETDRYIVERSADGQKFSTASSLKATGWQGLANSYQHSDQPQSTRTVFYRIRVVDLNGKQTISNTVSVNFSPSRGGHQLYPNPARGNAFVSFSEAGSYQVSLVSDGGQVMQAFRVDAASAGTTATIEKHQLPAGLYLVRISNLKNGSSSTQRLILQ